MVVAPVLNIRFCPASNSVVCSSGCRILLFSLDSKAVKTQDLSHWIRAIAVSLDESQIAVGLEKSISILNFSTLELISTVETEKRIVSLAFSNEGDLLIADKTGRGQNWTVSQQNRSKEIHQSGETPDKETKQSIKPSTILGHLSVLTDLVYDPAGRVLTSDKDWKIRVSSYPHAYNIEAFCLGHTEFVSGIVLVPFLPDHLISGGGDGYIRLWNHPNGTEICSILLPHDDSDNTAQPESLPIACTSNRYIIVSRGKFLYQLRINDQTKALEMISKQDCQNKILHGCAFKDNLVLISYLEPPLLHSFQIHSSGFESKEENLDQLNQQLQIIDDTLRMEILNEKMEQLLARRTANLKEKNKRFKF